MEEMSSEVQSATLPPKKEGGKPKRKRVLPGRFGSYGGRYVPETLMGAIHQLEVILGSARVER